MKTFLTVLGLLIGFCFVIWLYIKSGHHNRLDDYRKDEE